MLHPFRSGRSLITAATYLPACSHTSVRAKHGRSDSSSRARSPSAVPAPILTAAAAFDSVVSTNIWIDRRLPLYAHPNNPAGQAPKCGCRTRRPAPQCEDADILLALLIALLRKGGQLVGRGHGPGSHPDPSRPSDPGHGVQPGWHPAGQLQRRGDDPVMGHGYRPGTALGRTDSPVG